MEANETNLNVKLAQLQLTGKRTAGIISSGKQEAIERHCQTLKTISSEINVMRISIEAEKISQKVEIEDIVERKKGVETKLDEADEEIEKNRQMASRLRKENRGGSTRRRAEISGEITSN